MTRLPSIHLLASVFFLCAGLAMGGLPQEWRLRTWQNGQPHLTKPAVPSDADGALLPLSCPGRTECVTGVDLNAWSRATGVVLRFKAPDTLPAHAILTIFTKDGDDLWRQIRLPFPCPDQNGVSQAQLP